MASVQLCGAGTLNILMALSPSLYPTALDKYFFSSLQQTVKQICRQNRFRGNWLFSPSLSLSLSLSLYHSPTYIHRHVYNLSYKQIQSIQSPTCN